MYLIDTKIQIQVSLKTEILKGERTIRRKLSKTLRLLLKKV